MKQYQERKTNYQKYIFFFITTPLTVIFITLLTLYFYLFFQFNKRVVLEYGNALTWSDITNLNITTPIPEIKDVGTYNLKFEYFSFPFNVEIIVNETVPPIVSVKDILIYSDESLPVTKDFIVSIEDSSETIVQDIVFENILGEQKKELIVKDFYGNITSVEVTLTIIENDIPNIDGLSDIDIYVGGSVNLNSNVRAYNKENQDVPFTVDDSQVNYRRAGTYTIYYKVNDSKSVEHVHERKITIRNRYVETPTFLIPNFPTYRQHPNYPNGCEGIALYTLLRYYNVNVDPEGIMNRLKKGNGPYWSSGVLYGGNPEREFVGNPKSRYGYGVFQKPIMDVANSYKSGMVDYTGHSLNEVLNLVSNNIPVQVWASIDLRNTSVCTSWIDDVTGVRVNWICNLHSLVIVGYSNSRIYVSDPTHGSILNYNRSQFEKMYNTFGKRALYYPN